MQDHRALHLEVLETRFPFDAAAGGVEDLHIELTKSESEFTWAYDLASMLQVAIFGYAVAGAFLGLAYFDLTAVTPFCSIAAPKSR